MSLCLSLPVLSEFVTVLFYFEGLLPVLLCHWTFPVFVSCWPRPPPVWRHLGFFVTVTFFLFCVLVFTSSFVFFLDGADPVRSGLHCVTVNPPPLTRTPTVFVVFLGWSFLFLLPVLTFAHVVVSWFIARDLWDFSALLNRLSGSDPRCSEAHQKGPAPSSVSTFGSRTFHPGVSKAGLDSKCHLHWKTHHIFGGKTPANRN